MSHPHEPTNVAGIVSHHGFFQKQISLFEAVALIVSGTIGAGILSLPYAISKSGLGIGLLYILGLGLLMMGMNILLGEIAIRAGTPLQLAGLAKKYLGTWGELVVSGLVYTLVLGVLVVYIIGEGTGLSALFGGSPFAWSTGFALFGMCLISLGIRTIKKVELLLSGSVLCVVLLVSAFSIRHISFDHLEYLNLARVLFPYGVVLFALHGTTAIPEAYSLLRNKEQDFKKAIMISSAIVIAVYMLFAVVVVGVTGNNTTEIATLGLGRAVGPAIFLLGNIFAVLAMGTSFLMAGLSLRDSLSWDFRVPSLLATVLVCGIPYLLFVLGMRSFIATIDVVGGVFMSLEMLFLVCIYLRARRQHPAISGYSVEHSWMVVSLLLLALSIGTVYSIVNVF